VFFLSLVFVYTVSYYINFAIPNCLRTPSLPIFSPPHSKKGSNRTYLCRLQAYFLSFVVIMFQVHTEDYVSTLYYADLNVVFSVLVLLSKFLLIQSFNPLYSATFFFVKYSQFHVTIWYSAFHIFK
jgi:hypothetical protein